MARSLFFSASVVGIPLLCCAGVPATATDVTYTGQKNVITQPGTYVLKNDITNSTQLICIEIQASTSSSGPTRCDVGQAAAEGDTSAVEGRVGSSRYT